MVSDIDISAAHFRADPHSQWRKLREKGPLHRDAKGAWVVVQFEAVAALLRDSRLGKDLRRAELYQSKRPYGAGSLVEQYVEQWMASRLPQRHAQWRRLVSRALAADLPGLENKIRSIAEDLLDQLHGESSFDLVEEFASPLTMRVMAIAIGLPKDEIDHLESLSAAVGRVLEPDAPPTVREDGDQALYGLLGFLNELVAAYRRRPQEGFFANLNVPGEDGTHLEDEEIVATLLLLLLSGHETSAGLVANGALALLQHPIEAGRARLRLAEMPGAIDEIIRYEGPASMAVRAAYEEIRLGETSIPAGALVLLSLASANRDERVFSKPDKLQFGRPKTPHLGFGSGPHHCPGAILARLETGVALERLFTRLPDLRHDEASLRWKDADFLRSLARLRVWSGGIHTGAHQGGSNPC